MKNTKSKFQVWHDDNGIANIDFDYVKSSQRDNNEDRYGCDGCFICMKPIKSSNHNFWVHYTTAGTLINTIKEVEDSQGCFQIGPDCAKKLPSDFVFELLRATDWQYTPEG